MKKKLRNTILKVMRIFLVLIAIGLSSARANTALGQSKVDINVENVSLEELFKEIQKASSFIFFYNDNVLNNKKRISIMLNNVAVSEILDKAFLNTDLTYKIIEKQIVIKKNELTPTKIIINNSNLLKQFELSGTIYDINGKPLPGANILEKGTTNGVTSDFDGKYSINLSNENAVLVVSYIGFASKEVIVNGKISLDVILEESAAGLEEVVLVGYGVQKRVNVIGSVETVGAKELSRVAVSNISNALAGQLPGAVIQQSNGEPGNDRSTIRIRGTGTIGNGEPLVVIDGIPGRDLNSLNISDVESISVLKDASAAIYGARAANGVILITTKKGSKETPLTLNYGFYYGFQSPTKLPKMANAATYAEMIRETQLYAGVDEANMKYSLGDIERFQSGLFPWTNPNTDWFKESLADFSITKNHNLSLSGGSKDVSYWISFGSQQDEGIFKNSPTKFNRYNIKANVNANVNKYLSLGLDINSSQENRNYPSTSANFNFEGAIKSLPTSAAFYPNGFPGPDISYGQNPVVSSTSQTGFDNSKKYRTNTIFSANLKIPEITGLTLSSYYAYDLSLGQRKLFQTPWTLYQLNEPAYFASGNTGVEDGSAFLVGSLKGGDIKPFLRNYYDDSVTKTFNAKLDYIKTINNVHNFNAFFAYETSEFEGKGITAFRRNFISDRLPYLFAGSDAEKDNSEFVSIDSRINYFGRFSYDYNETYLFQLSFRRDGSLRFSKENGRWGNFPSMLAGWKISNEDFWKKNMKFIDFFKLKASWGQMGNDLVDPFQYLSSFELSTGAVLGSRFYSAGLSQDTASNPLITWEVANVYNAGFESLMFNNRLELNLDVFYQRRNNILIKRNASVPEFTGINLPDENFGLVDNRGFEVVLGYHDQIDAFSYSFNANMAFSRNKVIEFDEPAQNVPWQKLTGNPLGTELLYNAIGIFRDQAQINNTPHVEGAQPGDIIIEDFDKNGEINNDDRILFPETVAPEITYGISFNFNYKNWGLSGLVQGTGNSMRRMYAQLQGFSGNYFEYDANGRWTPENIDAQKPRAFDRNDAYWRSDYLTNYTFQSTAYARMKNMQLTYSLPKSIQESFGLSTGQIYLSGQNLFLIYSGNKITDPELGGNERLDDQYSTNATFYPLMKTFAIGARITF